MELFIIGVIVGILACFIAVKVISSRNKPSGTFVIDLTDPAKDVCRFEMDESLNVIFTKKQITLNVRVYGDYSPN